VGDSFYFRSKVDEEANIAFLQDTEVTVGSEPNYCVGYDSVISFRYGQELSITSDVSGYLYIAVRRTGARNVYPEIAVTYKQKEVGLARNKVITPFIIYERLSISGDFNNSSANNQQVASTPRFIKISGNKYVFSSQEDCFMSIFFYDKNFSFISRSELQLYSNYESPVEASVPSSSAYMKLSFIKDEDGEQIIGIPIVKISGDFEENWDVFNPRSNDSGYHRVVVQVNITNPNCCDFITDDGTVEDFPVYKMDYGVICLPKTYTNVGKATRLIIYCHGAAVNYTSSVTRFNSVDLEPDYWLAEGYAIMDVEGNPFNNEDEHVQTPQAMDCYVAAYNWAIEHYNLRRDGIFLGGRSMGGGMTFNLLKDQCPIPVIAACPNVPSSMCLSNANPHTPTTPQRQEFYCVHCGFDIPENFDWSNTTNPYWKEGADTYTEGSKRKLFYDNWDKLVKNNPLFTLCTDLPIKFPEEMELEDPHINDPVRNLIDNYFVGYNSSTVHRPSDRNSIWGKLHAKAKCPIKLFGCLQDETCRPENTSILYKRMLTNGASLVECRLFNSFWDYTGESGNTAHHYDTQDLNLRTSVTTKYGEQMTNIPVVYVEMLQFWRRYEQIN